MKVALYALFMRVLYIAIAFFSPLKETTVLIAPMVCSTTFPASP
uniref:Uncharacterized protein n=1 Tax=Arundo donax TaxID=35708 RepID=A0A0A9FUN6_ARUDO